MRAFLSGGLISGAVVWALIGLMFFAAAFSNVQSMWGVLGTGIAALICCLLWKSPSFHDEDEWELTTRGKRILAFIVTPWGAALVATIGLVILGLFIAYQFLVSDD